MKLVYLIMETPVMVVHCESIVDHNVTDDPVVWQFHQPSANPMSCFYFSQIFHKINCNLHVQLAGIPMHPPVF